MRLTPHEQEWLLIRVAAQAARARRARGLQLNHPETVAVLSKTGCSNRRAGPGTSPRSWSSDAAPCEPLTDVGPSGAGARLPLADDAVLVLAAGLDRPAVSAIVARLVDGLHSPVDSRVRYGKTIRPIPA